MQDSSQITGSTSISKTMTRVIKIPTANLRHSTMANSSGPHCIEMGAIFASIRQLTASNATMVTLRLA